MSIFMTDQINIIEKINRLCQERKYDEAIALTNEIIDFEISVKAHLLCIEHEVNWKKRLAKHLKN